MPINYDNKGCSTTMFTIFRNVYTHKLNLCLAAVITDYNGVSNVINSGASPPHILPLIYFNLIPYAS